MPTCTLEPLVGEYFDRHAMRKLRVEYRDMDRVILDGKEVAKLGKVPGAPVALFSWVPPLSPSEREAIAAAIAAERGGVRPSKIEGPVELPFDVLDDEEDTDIDDE